jgi:transcriptional regulator with XRE-family HTH domain
MGVQDERKQATATFGAGLRALREASGLSLNQLAKKMGWTAVYQSDVERNRAHPPNIKRLTEIARYLGTNVEQLIRLAAADKGFVRLEINPQSETELCTATMLVNRWATLTEDQLKSIQRIVNGNTRPI